MLNQAALCNWLRVQ